MVRGKGVAAAHMPETAVAPQCLCQREHHIPLCSSYCSKARLVCQLLWKICLRGLLLMCSGRLPIVFRFFFARGELRAAEEEDDEPNKRSLRAGVSIDFKNVVSFVLDWKRHTHKGHNTTTNYNIGTHSRT